MINYDDLKAALAPIGRLRASINLGNPILASRDAEGGGAVGVSVDLARELGSRLDLPLELVVVDLAARSVDAVAQETADVGFFAIDPLRGAAIDFTPPYLLIEGCYLVRDDSELQSNLEVDRPGRTVVVGKGSAYDLYLSRTLMNAEIMRAASSQAVVDCFVQQRLDVAAGVKQQLESDARRQGGLRLLPDRFMVIRQAMGLPKSRGPSAAAFLSAFVQEMRDSGFVQQSLNRHGVSGASVAAAND